MLSAAIIVLAALTALPLTLAEGVTPKSAHTPGLGVALHLSVRLIYGWLQTPFRGAI